MYIFSRAFIRTSIKEQVVLKFTKNEFLHSTKNVFALCKKFFQAVYTYLHYAKKFQAVYTYLHHAKIISSRIDFFHKYTGPSYNPLHNPIFT